MKTVLMIAFHYPPVRGSSGLQRTLKFSSYLRDLGWRPIVLTVSPRAYQQSGPEQLREIPDDVPVCRAFGLDAARHLAISGRYPGLLALPDRWSSWFIGGLPAGMHLVRRYRPDVLWSTYPIATAHLIGLSLHMLTRVPWVADFRDSMTEEGYPRTRGRRAVFGWLERLTVRHSRRSVFTAPGAVRMYAERYPEIPSRRWALIPNGYDEQNFVEVERLGGPAAGSAANGPLRLVHSGLLYRSERDPRAFFAAIGELLRSGAVSPDTLQVVLRASGDEAHHRQSLRQNGIEEIVHLEPALPYSEALAEMLAADGLLIFQASNCNHQIPAKLFEYLRARRPILALTDPRGDTAGVLRGARSGTVVPLDSTPRIVEALPAFLTEIREGRAALASDAEVQRHSRRSRTEELAGLLDAAISGD